MGFGDFLEEILEVEMIEDMARPRRGRGYGYNQGSLGVGVPLNDAGFDVSLGDGLGYDPMTGDFGVEIAPGLYENF